MECEHEKLIKEYFEKSNIYNYKLECYQFSLSQDEEGHENWEFYSKITVTKILGRKIEKFKDDEGCEDERVVYQYDEPSFTFLKHPRSQEKGFTAMFKLADGAEFVESNSDHEEMDKILAHEKTQLNYTIETMNTPYTKIKFGEVNLRESKSLRCIVNGWDGQTKFAYGYGDLYWALTKCYQQIVQAWEMGTKFSYTDEEKETIVGITINDRQYKVKEIWDDRIWYYTSNPHMHEKFEDNNSAYVEWETAQNCLVDYQYKDIVYGFMGKLYYNGEEISGNIRSMYRSAVPSYLDVSYYEIMNIEASFRNTFVRHILDKIFPKDHEITYETESYCEKFKYKSKGDEAKVPVTIIDYDFNIHKLEWNVHGINTLIQHHFKRTDIFAINLFNNWWCPNITSKLIHMDLDKIVKLPTEEFQTEIKKVHEYLNMQYLDVK